MMSRLSIALCLVWMATTVPALAFTDINIRVEPIQPLAGEDFVIVVEGMADTHPITVEDVTQDGQELDLRLHRPACLVFFCAPQSFRVEIPIDGSTSVFDEDLVALRLEGRVGSSTDQLLLAYTHFAIGESFYHSMSPEMVLNPATPTDNENVQLLVPVVANVCGPWTPWLDRIERTGSKLSVFLRFNSGFGPEFLAPNELDPKCSPAVPYLSVTPVELGAFKPGTYSMDLYFQSTREHSLPIRVGRRPFQITDAPDSVGLHDGRFSVEIEWMDSGGNTGVAKPVPDPASDSTLFTFFDSDNWEILVKVLDGCAVNDRFWVFGAAATDIEYTITVTDTNRGEVWTYTNPLGTASAAINDTNAFATCP